MKALGVLQHLIAGARESCWSLFLLNLLLAWLIPYNRPHRLKIEEIGPDQLVTACPYRRSNHNHIRGIHACAIATVSEFSAGFLLLTKFDPQQYRLIMGQLEASYSYQAKKDIRAVTLLDNARLEREVFTPLEQDGIATIVMQTTVSDVSDREVAVVSTTWQIKHWDKVRTSV